MTQDDNKSEGHPPRTKKFAYVLLCFGILLSVILLSSLFIQLRNTQFFLESYYALFPLQNITPENVHDHRFSIALGDDALTRIRTITTFGTRALGYPGHDQLEKIIVDALQREHIPVSIDAWTYSPDETKKIPLHTIIGRISPERTRRIIIATHYDSTVRAYRDNKNPNGYMPGANNSASGVAIILSDIKVLQTIASTTPYGIDLIFFDGEEGSKSLGEGDHAWAPIGSIHFVDHIHEWYGSTTPELMIDLDMLCDRDLHVPPEYSSMHGAHDAVDKLWEIGNKNYPEQFPIGTYSSVADDHTSFLNKGLPAMLLIDFNYEWYNTTEDTAGKCSVVSLTAIIDTLNQFMSELK